MPTKLQNSKYAPPLCRLHSYALHRQGNYTDLHQKLDQGHFVRSGRVGVSVHSPVLSSLPQCLSYTIDEHSDENYMTLSTGEGWGEREKHKLSTHYMFSYVTYHVLRLTLFLQQSYGISVKIFI